MSVINHKHKYIFMHEPHTAGRSIEHALMEYHEGSENFNGNHHIAAIDMIDGGWCDEDQFEEYFKFRVIRNPYDWLVTCWFRNEKDDPFTTWVFKKGLGFTAKGTLFWRYQDQVDMNVRYEDDLEENLHYTFLTYGIPPVQLPMRTGAIENKPHWEKLLTVSQAKQLERLYPDINGYGYNLFR